MVELEVGSGLDCPKANDEPLVEDEAPKGESVAAGLDVAVRPKLKPADAGAAPGVVL